MGNMVIGPTGHAAGFGYTVDGGNVGPFILLDDPNVVRDWIDRNDPFSEDTRNPFDDYGFCPAN